jgi:hypothetical protein
VNICELFAILRPTLIEPLLSIDSEMQLDGKGVEELE